MKVFVLTYNTIEVYSNYEKANNAKNIIDTKIRLYKEIDKMLQTIQYYDSCGFQEIRGEEYNIFELSFIKHEYIEEENYLKFLGYDDILSDDVFYDSLDVKLVYNHDVNIEEKEVL